MLNQDNKYFNRYLTYLDQGGNNIWWSTNSTTNTTTVAELITTGVGIDSDCLEADCIPICSEIIENEQQSIETLSKPQQLIYPTFIKEFNRLTIRLNNLSLVDQPNYTEDGCIDSECVEEFGIWTKAIQTKNKVFVDDQVYYFVKANPDNYSFSYIYTLSLIHQETGEEIIIDKNKGLLSSTISIEYDVPEGFNIAISITKFTIEEIITTYRFIDKPFLLRSNFSTNLDWQPLSNNVEQILLSIIYILNTDLEIEDKNRLILYKDKQQTLINTLVESVISICSDNSASYSYIKNVTRPSSYNELTSNDNRNIEGIKLNPAIYKTTNYIEQEESNLIILLLLLTLTQFKSSLTTSLLTEYINKCITLQTYSLKEEVLKIIALTEAYKITKDIYVLSIATSTLNQINKRYKLENNQYIESLNNPITTVESKVFGDILEVYIYDKDINIKDYILSEIDYLQDVTNLYITNSPIILTNSSIYLILLRLFNINIPYYSLTNNNIIEELLNINNESYIQSNLLKTIDLYKQDVFNTIKLSIPTDFGWLSETTPIQDLIIESISKPLIDLYIHSNYIKDEIVEKEALTKNYLGIINNKEELLLKTFTSDVNSIASSLWPGKYSNSVDLEIKGFYDEFTLEQVNNIKSLGIQTNLLSSIDMPNIDNFDLCFNVSKLEDFRCQLDINGQLILLTDGQCNLAPPELSILLQENNCPITQESSITDYLLLESSSTNSDSYVLPPECKTTSDKWKAINGVCTIDPTGTYNSLTQCQASLIRIVEIVYRYYPTTSPDINEVKVYYAIPSGNITFNTTGTETRYGQTNPIINWTTPQGVILGSAAVIGTPTASYSFVNSIANIPPNSNIYISTVNKWKCTNKTCVLDVTGTFNSQAECTASGCGVKWKCQNGVCVQDSNGIYNSQAECQTALIPASFTGGQMTQNYCVIVKVTTNTEVYYDLGICGTPRYSSPPTNPLAFSSCSANTFAGPIPNNTALVKIRDNGYSQGWSLNTFPTVYIQVINSENPVLSIYEFRLLSGATDTGGNLPPQCP